jgi:hypothetical protein
LHIERQVPNFKLAGEFEHTPRISRPARCSDLSCVGGLPKDEAKAGFFDSAALIVIIQIAAGFALWIVKEFEDGVTKFQDYIKDISEYMMKITPEFIKEIPAPPRGVRIRYENKIGTLRIRMSRPSIRIHRFIENAWILVIFIGAFLEWRYGLLFKFWSWVMGNFEWYSRNSINRTYPCFLSICVSLWAACFLIVSALFRQILEISTSGIILKGAQKQQWMLPEGKSVIIENFNSLPIWNKGKRMVTEQTGDVQKVVVNIPNLTKKECIWLNEVLTKIRS